MQVKKAQVSIQPEMPVQYVKGVGPARAKLLARMGIKTVEELLFHFPVRWEDRRQFCTIREAQPHSQMTLQGKITSAHFFETPGGYAIASVVLDDGTGKLLCKWLRKQNRRYDVLLPFRKEFQPGVSLIVHGNLTLDFADKIMNVEEHELLTGAGEDHIHTSRIVPIYSLTEGLRQRTVRTLIFHLLSQVTVSDFLPEFLQKKEKLPSLQETLKKIHFPENFQEKEEARKRLAFQEFFLIQMVLAIAKKRNQMSRSVRYEVKKELLTPFKEKCGFKFTPSQKKAIREIFSDLTSNHPMNRLLQGDVGSGKTVAALSAMLLACENHFQSALLAPTEILAEQHYITFKHFLHSLPVKIGLLTGSVSKKEREKFLTECANGKIQIAIGTHALLQKEVRFANLGLVVIDEQHRFGVRHRMLAMRTKKSPHSLSQRERAGVRTPDVLVMTATPIPRTLALSIYGDLDLSMITELPPGRGKIETVQKSEAEAYAFIKEEVAKGHQAYIVFPLVDESDAMELKSAIQEFERLKKEVFQNYSVGLLHGQMPGRQKEEVMQNFYHNRFAILVTTTVIEVGIDVPNATIIVIQNAERFGLSTLHQLRGRVGRGKEPSYCVLVAHPKTEEAKQRISVLLQTQSGFDLAEKDLELRGAGELFGTAQHGMPPLKIANLIGDKELLLQARAAAFACVEDDPHLAKPENRLLKETLRKQFSKKWFWATVA